MVSELTPFRCRWSEAAGLAIVERRHNRRAFGIWPVYSWEDLAHFSSIEAGTKWLFDTYGPQLTTTTD